MGKRQLADAPEASAQGRVEYNVSAEKFVRVWQAASSVDEVVEKLRMPRGIVHARASNYRKSGVKLKNMPRTTSRGLDIEQLNAIIEELSQKSK